MLRNYFKAVEDFEAPVFVGEGLQTSEELFSIERGDIIVDVETFDDNYLVGKTIVSQKMLKMRKECIEELREDGDDDDDDKEPQKRLSNEIKNDKTGEETNERPKSILRNSFASSRSSPIDDDQKEMKEEYVHINQPLGTTSHPVAPPRSRKSREMTGNQGVTTTAEAFRSRGSDEGYNSSSHYSGEKPPDDDVKSPRRSYCNTVVSDVPLLTSFRESPQEISSPRHHSIQDDEGYEIPAFTPRVSIVNGEIATGDEKGVTLKFIYQRKSTNFDEPRSPDSAVKIPLDSIGEHSESFYETWATDSRKVKSSECKRKVCKERIFVALCLFMSFLVALGVFFVLLFIVQAAPLFCFTTAVSILAVILIGLLTMGKRRWLCIATLIAPSLFSRKAKIAFCIILCVLVIAGPVCNFSSNLKLVIQCRDMHGKHPINVIESEDAGKRIAPRQSKRGFKIFGDPIKISVRATRNETLSEKTNTSAQKNISNFLQECGVNYSSVKAKCLPSSQEFYKSCVHALKVMLKKTPDCSSKDISCVEHLYSSYILNVCRNLSEARLKGIPGAPGGFGTNKGQMDDTIFTFRNVLLQLLPLLLLFLLYEAYWYNRDYLSNKEMDNVYITGKLKALDCDRKERGLRNKLFPLRKLEFRKYVLPSSFLQTSVETKEVLRWLVIWSFLGLVVLLSILLDKSIYHALKFLGEQSNSCTVKLTSLNMEIIYSLSIVLALLVIIITFQSYVLRSRSRICSFFYPKKESARGVYLYYKILHDRAHFWKKCRERGRMLSEARRTRWRIGIGHRVFSSLPVKLRRLFERLLVYRCMICNSLTCRKTFVCKDEECFATFCYECYIDMGQACISCRPSAARDSVFTSV